MVLMGELPIQGSAYATGLLALSWRRFENGSPAPLSGRSTSIQACVCFQLTTSQKPAAVHTVRSTSPPQISAIHVSGPARLLSCC